MSREFHDTVVRECGNPVIGVVIGALEALWMGYESLWAGRRDDAGTYPSAADRRAVMRTHAKITAHIASGDRVRAQRAARRHLEESQRVMMGEAAAEVVDSIGQWLH